MLLVDNFLIVFSLEVGGKFIGWFGLITNAIVLPLSLLLLIAISIDKDLSHIRGELDEMSFGKMDFHLDTSDENRVKQMRQSFIMGLILVIIISTIYLIASAMLIRGTTNRNCRQLSPARNILAFLAIFSIFALYLRPSISSMINAILYIYAFAIVYSLWCKFKKEEETGPVELPFHSIAA